ncbi:MAG: hypothetical protein AB1435_06410, partial [Chloroflexota bacterium]
QTVDQRGAAVRVSQGMDDLGAAGVGYEATIVVRQGRLNADGAPDSAAASEWAYTLRVDVEGDLQATLAGGDAPGTYVVPGDQPPPAPVYRVTAGSYACASDDPAATALSAGLAGLIAAHDALAAAPQTLAVIAEPEETTVASREATQHAFVSRVADALRILDTYGGDEALQQAVAAAETVAFSGEVVFDDATGALLRLHSTTIRRDQGQWTEFRFELTQWDGVPDVARPDAAQTARPCG